MTNVVSDGYDAYNQAYAIQPQFPGGTDIEVDFGGPVLTTAAPNNLKWVRDCEFSHDFRDFSPRFHQNLWDFSDHLCRHS